MAAEFAERAASGRIPNDDDIVLPAADERLAVWSERERPDGAAMAEQFAVRHRRLVNGGDRGGDFGSVELELINALLQIGRRDVVGIPEHHASIFAGGGDLVRDGRELCREYGALVHGKRLRLGVVGVGWSVFGLLPHDHL